MMKFTFPFILFLFAAGVAFSQKRDTTVYFVKETGRTVSLMEQADYVLFVISPDTAIDKVLYLVKGYYRNGKPRLIGYSLNHTIPLTYQGNYLEFYPNGHKRKLMQYDNGNPVGEIIEFYPNGRFYCKKLRLEIKPPKSVFHYVDMDDSTGNVLTKDGNGRWIEYNKDFTEITAQGNIRNALRDSIWREKGPDSAAWFGFYKDGKIINFFSFDNQSGNKNGNATDKSLVEAMPRQINSVKAPAFPGGLRAFYRFLKKNIKYPPIAKENGTQGLVIVNFIVKEDGSLSDIKVVHGLGDGCDEEAVSVLKHCRKWLPGLVNEIPVRSAYTVPVSFSLR